MRETALVGEIRAPGGVREAARAFDASHSAAADSEAAVDDSDAARAQEYALLSALLMRAPDARLLEKLAMLRGDPSPLGLAHAALADAAARTDADRVGREFFDLFIGLG